MKLAVVGGGTAGYIAAAHLSHNFPQAELLHLFDSSIPTIGVGEGTTPRFPMWFREITGLGFEVLAQRCRATRKKGVLFDGWGPTGTPFLHRFQPIWLEGYHVDAGALLAVLEEHIRARHIDARVEAIDTSAASAAIRLAGGAVERCDYVLDARGFPRIPEGTAATGLVRLDWIPTGRALLRRLPPGLLADATRAAARPHGWIFQIPLRDWTSCGYVCNGRISTDAEVAEDFTAFLREEGLHEWQDRGALDFPNYMHATPFDGRLFRVGNAAAFIEPLEATAIGTAIVQIRAAAAWIARHGAAGSGDAGAIAAHNEALRTYLCRDSLFIALHYANGSRWDTPFWRHARQGLERARRSAFARPHLEAMDPYLAAGEALPGAALAQYEDKDAWDRDIIPQMRLFAPYGNFSALNFAQVGHGIGLYGTHEAAPARAALPVA